MKYYSLLVLFIIAKISLAQPPGYDDLKILYADEKFEKLVDKAVKYTEKDDTKKDPNAYIWVAKGFYKISIMGNDDPDFKNAFKDGVKYMGKAMKYDTDGSAVEKHFEFVNKFTNAAAERIINDVQAGDFSKAYGWNVKYLKMAKNMAGAKYMEGACKFRRGDKSGGSASWKEADAELEEVTSLDSWWEADKRLLMQGVMESAKCMVDTRQTQKAKDLLNRFAPWFDTNEEFKAFYDEVING